MGCSASRARTHVEFFNPLLRHGAFASAEMPAAARDRARGGEIFRQRVPPHQALLFPVLAEKADALREPARG